VLEKGDQGYKLKVIFAPMILFIGAVFETNLSDAPSLKTAVINDNWRNSLFLVVAGCCSRAVCNLKNMITGAMFNRTGYPVTLWADL